MTKIFKTMVTFVTVCDGNDKLIVKTMVMLVTVWDGPNGDDQHIQG